LLTAMTVLLVWNVRSVWQSETVINMPDGVNIEAADVASVLARAHRKGDILVATLPASAPVIYYLDRRGQSLSYWSDPSPSRIVAVLDKPPDREFTEDARGRAIRQAFDASFPDLDQSGYHISQTLYDNTRTRVVALERDLP
jgi:hypothetical protein